MAGVLIDGGSVLIDGGSVLTFGGEAAAAGSDPALGGFRSLYGFWLGGAGVAPTTPSGGPRSLLAPWLGGAGANTRTAGFSGLLAFWLGGGAAAASGSTATVIPNVYSGIRKLTPAMLRKMQRRDAKRTTADRLRIEEEEIALFLLLDN